MWEEYNKHNKQIDMAEWNDRESQGGRDMKERQLESEGQERDRGRERARGRKTERARPSLTFINRHDRPHRDPTGETDKLAFKI